MTVEHWLENAVADAERRGLSELKPLLDGLAQATMILRSATLTESADSSSPKEPGADGSSGRPAR